MRSFFLSASLATVTGHGMINYPPPRNFHSLTQHGCVGDHIFQKANQGTCLWFNQGCQSGCPSCKTGCGDGAGGKGPDCCSAAEGLKAPILPDALRTFTDQHPENDFEHTPWRAPGYAPIADPCGLAGGASVPGQPGNGGDPPNGISQGFPGSQMLPRSKVDTVWAAGDVVDVSWDITANHGGGYSYRLCPKGSALTEACFEKTPLDFVGGVQWIQVGTNFDSGRTEIPAVRTSVSKGNATWTRNPIPACDGIYGGSVHEACKGPQFDPPLKSLHPASEWKAEAGLYGFGSGTCTSRLPGKACTKAEHAYWTQLFSFNIVDQVRVPEALPGGDYVLSWRWDAEQTPQIWAGCSDVTIKAKPGPDSVLNIQHNSTRKEMF